MDIKYLAYYYSKQALIIKNNKLDVKASFINIMNLLTIKPNYEHYLFNKLGLAAMKNDYHYSMMNPIKKLLIKNANNDAFALINYEYLSTLALLKPSILAKEAKSVQKCTLSELQTVIFTKLARYLDGIEAKYFAQLAIKKELARLKSLLTKRKEKLKINLELGSGFSKTKQAYKSKILLKSACLFYGSTSKEAKLASLKQIKDINTSFDLDDFLLQIKWLQRMICLLERKAIADKSKLCEKVKNDLSRLARLSLDELKLYIFQKDIDENDRYLLALAASKQGRY